MLINTRNARMFIINNSCPIYLFPFHFNRANDTFVRLFLIVAN